MASHVRHSFAAAVDTQTPIRLMRRLRDELRVQAHLARMEAKARWADVGSRLERPEQWPEQMVDGARTVLRRARRRVSELRSGVVEALRSSAR